jgi:integrase
LRRFCERGNSNPDELLRLSKRTIEGRIQAYVDELARQGRSKSYVNGVTKRLRTFFRVNGYAGHRELSLNTQFVPARYRKRAEYIPTKDEIYAMADASDALKNRAVITVLWTSGLRVSTFCALNYGDVADDLTKKETCVKVPVYAEMKTRVFDACKGSVPYYTFIAENAATDIATYLRDREDKYGALRLEDPLFHSEWNFFDPSSRTRMRLGRRAVGQIVKRAAKRAGIRQWQHITPHSLRKA